MSDLLDYILKEEDAFRRNRLPSLYSDFTLQKRTNPDGYTVNVAAWEHALTRAARNGRIHKTSKAAAASSSLSKTNAGRREEREGKQKGTSDHLVLRTGDALLRALELPEWGRPVALSCVFDEALRRNTMVPLQMFKTSPGILLRKKHWNVIDPSAFSPLHIMGWGMKQLRGLVVGNDISDTSGHLKEQELVLVENLQAASAEVVKRALSRSSSKIDLIYSKESFANEFGNVLSRESQLSATDFDVLLLYLSRDVGAIAYDGETIKFKGPTETAVRITQQDRTIASIRTLIATMSKQVEGLERKIDELNSAAKTALANKNRISALSAVRSKKLAEHNLKQRLDTLHQLEEIYSKIEQATDQVEIVSVVEASTGVLRGLHAQLGGVERVEDVVEGLREEMSKVDEVGSIINEAGPVIDEAEIDDEMEALERAEQQTKEDAEAEATRRRLAQLEQSDRAAKVGAQEAKAERASDVALAESIEQLSRMSVEDDSKETTRPAPKERPLQAS